MNDGRLQKQIVSGNLEGAVKRGRGGKETIQEIEERVDRLRDERRPGVWHRVRLESHVRWRQRRGTKRSKRGAEVRGHVEEPGRRG